MNDPLNIKYVQYRCESQFALINLLYYHIIVLLPQTTVVSEGQCQHTSADLLFALHDQMYPTSLPDSEHCRSVACRCSTDTGRRDTDIHRIENTLSVGTAIHRYQT